MRKVHLIVIATIVGVSGLIGVAPAHAVYCGRVGGIDPCAAVCRVGQTAKLNCFFGP